LAPHLLTLLDLAIAAGRQWPIFDETQYPGAQ
jgi:hypothetical protein